MSLANKPIRNLAAALAACLFAGSAVAFSLDSDVPISVKANSARLDDSKGVATYTGNVHLTQGATELTADKVTLYRDAEGLRRIEATGKPAHYRQPARDGQGETDARALNIIYSAPESRLTFKRKAVIEQNGNLFRGDIIHYDSVDRVVTAEGAANDDNGNGRVEMIIQPRSSQNRQDSDGSSQGQ
ncbi:lipopolysaccharide transport periplasmic protein LptA [uncultured Marinobacter sp.]|uniref:lipopolysaccharide transport periplasmic protein LptA n=1 Tax=uncultured Marinobacter sp. TaxID=187379 RepID=UPI0026261425|nr:lipopolysaccharide transport periplasmic protein LptA [uncultured Marinobacter sp.]